MLSRIFLGTLVLYFGFCVSAEVVAVAVGRIKVVCTAALLPREYERRQQEYTQGINRIKEFGFMPYIVESCALGPTFLDTFSDRVWYAHTNDYTKKNIGINEAKALLDFLEHNHFDDEDLIVKVTGRYYFVDDYFLQYVAHNEYDAYVKDVSNLAAHNGVSLFTACFALRYKYFIEFLEQLDFEEMERKWLCIEWMLGDYIASKKDIKVYMLGNLNLRYRISYENMERVI